MKESQATGVETSFGMLFVPFTKGRHCTLVCLGETLTTFAWFKSSDV